MAGAGFGAPVSAREAASSATPPFAALPTAPALARGHVRATLADWGLGGVADDAEAIASEMTANAVAASVPMWTEGDVPVIQICLLADSDMLTIECWDQASGEPVPRETAGFAESGRGLAIIDYLTYGAWGWHPAIGQRAKCVWAQIPLRATTRDYLSFVVTGRNRPADQPEKRPLPCRTADFGCPRSFAHGRLAVEFSAYQRAASQTSQLQLGGPQGANAGATNAAPLWAELRERVYPGGPTYLRQYLARFRGNTAAPEPTPAVPGSPAASALHQRQAGAERAQEPGLRRGVPAARIQGLF